MKKVLLSLLLASGLFSAQKIEVSASYGMSSMYGGSYGLSYDIANGIIPSSVSNGDGRSPSSMGVAIIGVAMYSENTKWRFGVDIANEFFNNTSTAKENMFSVLPKVDYFWLKKEKLGLYSGAGAGVNFVSNTYINQNNNQIEDNYGMFAFNVTPIGVKYGGDLSVFLETNVGIKGIVQGGVSYRF
ncbi:hypothetical protein [Chryseobacterium sp.]|uniref:hypothetical protein n=1 Tax=Chryseobacterium sp. TaxID=1871047 RepID=UPI000EE141C0|nr:hypothetical protein [Chryseobacterium sp.]HCA06637.1 hypothetical protein [Chryseobacterium sp.]